MSEERECAAEVVSALLRGKLQGQQMVFRVVGIRPLVHESESCEQVHAGLVARIHLGEHEWRAVETPGIVTQRTITEESRVSPRCVPRTFKAVAIYEIW